MKKSIFLGFLGVWLMSPPKSSHLERNAASASSSASNSPAASPSTSTIPDLKSKDFVSKLLYTLESTDDPVQKNDLLSLALINAYEEGWTNRVLEELENMRKIFLGKN